MNETFIAASDYTKRKWYVIDCKGKKLGRLASTVSSLLSGKQKSYYHPASDLGDYVILINAEFLTLDRKIEKFHVFRPGRPGHSLKRLINPLPQRIIENCVYGMLPNGFARRHLPERLKVYQGPQHPHIAQSPVQLEEFENFN